jgi:fructose-1,6-bisphosphatase/inositol monophosphatase family enzyme
VTGGSILLDSGGGPLKARRKRSQSDIVTAAELASERAVLDLPVRVAPDGVVCEECGARSGASSDTWVIDPLDGTANDTNALEEFGAIVGHVRPWAASVAVERCPGRAHLTRLERAPL